MKVDESYEERKNPTPLAITLIPVAVASNLCWMEQNQEPNNTKQNQFHLFLARLCDFLFVFLEVLVEGVESDPHQKMIHMGKSEIDHHIRKVIHIPIGKVITIYYLVKS